MGKRYRSADNLFAIVRAGLWGGPASADVAAQWEPIVAEARRQGVTGLFCEGVRLLPASMMPSSQLRMSLLLEYDALERRSAHVEAVASGLVSHFRAAGLAPVVQKGPSIAQYYPKPSIRKSGDIDIYFPAGEFAEARKMAVNWAGTGLDIAPDGSICYAFDGVTVEHHCRFFDSKAQFDGIEPDSREAAVLLQITHILKHALGPGIGLKQICDYAVATRRILPNCDAGVLASCISDAHLRRWLGRLDAFISKYLGVPEDELLTTKAGIGRLSATPLLNIVLQGGEFGHHNPFRTLTASPGRRKLNTARFFFRRLPFALSTAPGEWWHTFSLLLKGNLTH